MFEYTDNRVSSRKARFPSVSRQSFIMASWHRRRGNLDMLLAASSAAHSLGMFQSNHVG